jgi:DNA replicative helicase MCM subunit Mcm2 (Cdc46/Mcm family)
MWLLLDKQDPEQDRRLAQHILGVHQGVVNKVRRGGDGGLGDQGSQRGRRGPGLAPTRHSRPHPTPPPPFQPLQTPKDETLGELVSPELLRAYISLARRQEPFVPGDLSDYVVAHYCALRQKERDEMDGRSYVTPRTLLSILRLAQAVAKLRFDETVRRGLGGWGDGRVWAVAVPRACC